jgi:glycosyltransferase involved in cell wall biosynthesis
MFIDEAVEIGGAEINLSLLAVELLKQGHLISIVLPGTGAFSKKLRNEGLGVEYVSGVPSLSVSMYWLNKYKIPNPFALVVDLFLGLVWFFRLWFLIRKTKPEIVQTVSMWAHAWGGLAARLAAVPVIAHFQDIVDVSSGFGLFRRLLHAWAEMIPDQIVCISQKSAEQFNANSGLKNKVRVIVNTVDINKYLDKERVLAVLADKRCFQLGTVARITHWKGQAVALQVAHELKLQRINFNWTFVGTPVLGSNDYYQQLLQIVDQWGLHDCVQFIGWLDDVPSFYRSLDVLLHLPIEPEPFGLVLIEAMASGVPVIASSGGGADDLIISGGGILVSPSDVDQCISAIKKIMYTPFEWSKRSKLARQFAVETFSLEGYMSEWNSVYQFALRKEGVK